jgi:hypothetical protein
LVCFGSLNGIQTLKRDNKGKESGGDFLNRKTPIDLVSLEANHSGDRFAVVGPSEFRGFLFHPKEIDRIPAVDECNGNLAYSKIEIDGVDPLFDDLLLDDKSRSQSRMPGEGKLCLRGEDADIISAVSFLIGKDKRRFREMHLPGDFLHQLVRNIRAFSEDG